jgi:hypothetical protein
MVLHLVLIPSRADAEEESSIRYPIQCRYSLGERKRFVLRHQADACPK